MRIRTQFVIAVLLFGATLAVISASAIITSLREASVAEQESKALRMALGAAEMEHLSEDYVMYREQQQLNRWNARFASFSAELDGLRALSAEQQPLVSNIQADVRRLKEVFDSISAAPEGTQGHPASSELSAIRVSWSRMVIASQALASDASRLWLDLDIQADRIARTNMYVLFAMVGVFSVYFVFIVFLVQRRVLRSIAVLHAGTKVVGSGDLDFRIEEGKHDEVGELSRAFNRMTADLRAVTASKVDLEREVRERRKAEEALRRSRDRSQILSEANALLLSSAEPEAEVQTLAARVAAHLDCDVFFNYILDEPKGRLRLNAHAGVPPDVVSRIESLDWGEAISGAVVRDGRPIISEDVQRNGDERAAVLRSLGVQAFAVHPLQVDGETVGTLGFGTSSRTSFADDELDLMRTVADQVSVALQRRAAQEAIRISEENYRRIVETAGEGIVISSPEGLITFANQRIADMLGYSMREIIGRTGLDFMDEDQRPLVLKSRGELGQGVPTQEELRFRRKDGSFLWTLCSGTPIVDENGNHVANLGMHTDVTERKKVSEMKDEFLGMVSHEMRTPLTVVLGGLHLLRVEGTRLTSEERDQLLQDACLEAESLADIINNLLELTRIRADRIMLHVNALDVKVALAGAVERAAKQHPDHQFAVEVSDGLPSIKADRTRVERILFNLLDNAAKYSPEHSTVRLTIACDGDGLAFAVADQGPGIAPEDQAKLFTPFERLGRTSAGRTGGTGLGLVVCKTLVEAHGGRIWVESASGHGSTFHFTLPPEPQAPAAPRTP